MCAEHEIVGARLNLDVVHRHAGQSIPELRPMRAAIDGEVHAELRPDERAKRRQALLEAQEKVLLTHAELSALVDVARELASARDPGSVLHTMSKPASYALLVPGIPFWILSRKA